MSEKYSDSEAANRDPLTGAPGAHPVGVGVGAASAGVAGAAVGAMVGGPVGAVVGAAVGSVAGGYAGKGVGEMIDPTVEESYWRETYPSRPYYSADTTYDHYAPAYRYGWESRNRYEGKRFEDVESDLERGWDNVKGSSSLAWHRAKEATRDAWNRVEDAVTPDHRNGLR
jgi:hypothetical protein